MKRKIAERRRQREEEEKQAEIERERKRREGGKNVSKIKEDMDQMQRKREHEQRRKEQQEERKEKERLRALIQRDKEERAKHHGKLPSKLGMEGYNPAVGYDGGEEGEEGDRHQTQGEEEEQQQQLCGLGAIDHFLHTLSRYRAGGDGGTAMKTVRAYLKNLLKDPSDERFQTINMENNAFKTRVKPFVGGLHILLEVGFEKVEAEDGQKSLVLNMEKFDIEFASDVFAKIDEAWEMYKQRNP